MAPLGDQAADRARLNCSSLLGFGPEVNDSGGVIGALASVERTEGGGGGDADRGDGHDAGRNRQIWKGIDLFAASKAEDGAAEEEERDVGANLGGEGEAGWRDQGQSARGPGTELFLQSY